MGVNKRLVFAGVAKQTAKGSAAANPTFGFGLLSGSWDPNITQEPDMITSTNRMVAGSNRDKAEPEMNVSTRAYDQLIGLLLYAACGAISTTGVGPYTHVITHDNDLPYLTLFGEHDGLWVKMQDAKIRSLKIAWVEAGLLTVEADFGAGDFVILASAWTATNDQSNRSRFRASGGTFKVDANATTPVTAPISAGEITITNNLEAVMLSKQITPDAQFPGVFDVEVALTLKPDDLNEWRKGVTGTAGGTTIANTPTTGAFEVFFSIDANTDLKIEASEVDFLSKLPDADPQGGKAEVQLVGHCYENAATDFKATVKNGTATY